MADSNPNLQSITDAYENNLIKLIKLNERMVSLNQKLYATPSALEAKDEKPSGGGLIFSLSETSASMKQMLSQMEINLTKLENLLFDYKEINENPKGDTLRS